LRSVAEVFGEDAPLTTNYTGNTPQMGYNTGSNRYADTIAITLVTGAISATASCTAFEFGDRSQIRLDLVVTAVTGTNPTLDVTVETSPDNSTWTTVSTFTQKTAAGSQHKLFSPIDRFVRVTETIGGTATPTFTRTISGEAV
jgi:hypothetical protein